jgi:hypothetical protein
MLDLVAERPIFARAATDNVGSIGVLQKCAFKIIGKNKDFANDTGEETIHSSPGSRSSTGKLSDSSFARNDAITEANDEANRYRSENSFKLL